MKKTKARSFLVALLILASLCSYIYVNTVTIPETNDVAETQETITDEVEKMEGEPKDIVLPDVQLLKKVIETSKRFLPASS